MGETKWLDAKTHRDPKWPVGGYAPGDYMGKCFVCKGDFINMDKRAMYCFPCAVEALSRACEASEVKVRQLEAERETLVAAFRIVQPLPDPPSPATGG